MPVGSAPAAPGIGEPGSSLTKPPSTADRLTAFPPPGGGVRDLVR
jgi:hypothetical protein